MKARGRAIVMAGAVLASGLSSFVRPARADQQSIELSAEQHFSAGVAAFDKKDYEAASKSFESAYRRTPDPRFLLNLALAVYKLEQLDATLKYLQRLQRDPNATTSQLQKVDGLLERVRPRMARLKIEAPAGTEIGLDGEPLGRAPLESPVLVDPALPNTVIARHRDGTSSIDVPILRNPVDFSVRVAVVADVPATPPFVPRPAAAPPPPSNAVGEGAPSNAPRNITVASLAGVGVVSLGLATYFGLRSFSDKDHAEELRGQIPNGACADLAYPGCLDLRETVQAQRERSQAANVLFAVGGGTLGVALALFLLWPRPEARKVKAMLIPAAAPGQAELHVVGAF
jgi:hypothetical protein